MPKFCSSCGSPVEEISKFCMKCGAPVGAASATPPVSLPAAPVPAATAGAQASPAPATAAKPSSPVMKIVLIVVGIFAFVTVAGIGSCVYFGYRAKKKVEQSFKMDGSSPSISIKTPGGDLHLGQRKRAPDEAIGGVVPYPGSVPTESGAEFSFGGKGGISSQEYESSDPVEKVVAFYKEKYENKLSVVENEGHYRLALMDPEGDQVTTIDVSSDEESGKTKIFIAHLGKGTAR